MTDDFAEREVLKGQIDSGRLIRVHCANTRCGTNPKSHINFGGARLLGRYYPGTHGEVKCSRCGHVSRFYITEKGCVMYE